MCTPTKVRVNSISVIDLNLHTKKMTMTQHSKLIEDTLILMLELESSIEAQASDICTDFYERRVVLQNEQQSVFDLEARISNKSPKRVFSPLNISVRMLRGSLQIYWHTVHFHRLTKKKHYKYIAKSKNGTYDLRTLKSKSGDAEWELVKETEESAAQLREQWRKLIQARSALIRLRELSK